MNRLRIVIKVVFWLVLLASPGVAYAQDEVFETSAPQAILIDAKSGIVFFEKNADELIQPASMSKLMTMTLVFEALKAGDLKLDQEFLISEYAWRHGGSAGGGSTMYANVNSRIKLVDLMYGSMIQSATPRMSSSCTRKSHAAPNRSQTTRPLL